jgi:Ricin-type beta-trefoil lectin domain
MRVEPQPFGSAWVPFLDIQAHPGTTVLHDERTAEMHELRFMGGVGPVLVAAGAVFGVALLSAGAASAADPVQLKSRLGNWCLDAPGGSNTATMVNPCNGSKSQLWSFNSAGQIESVAFPGQCVSISDAADNTPVMLSRCQTNANNVGWSLQSNGQITSVLGPCLNVFGGVAQPGTPVIAYHCIADVDDEKWDSVA